jgi:hypothetical protein
MVSHRGGSGSTSGQDMWDFLWKILILPNAPYSSIIWGWYIRPTSGRRTKRTQHIKENRINTYANM